MPASASSAASFSDADGSFSDGFRMKQLPQASATGIIHSGTISGKLNGVMPATTPSGWRIDQASMPVPTASVNSPFSRCGMPQANSTTSRPRCTSPSASDSTLPCSAVMIAESSLRSRSSSSFSLNITRARRSGGVAAQAGHAAAAAATALLDLGGIGQRDLGDDLAGGRVEHVAEFAAGAGNRLARDEMADVLHDRLPANHGGGLGRIRPAR